VNKKYLGLSKLTNQLFAKVSQRKVLFDDIQNIFSAALDRFSILGKFSY
jgi:hypothetical protein